MIKKLICALSVMTSLAFCAPSVKAVLPVVTNYSTVTITAILTTNALVQTSTGIKAIIGSKKLVTKDLLALLESPDFANFPFPTGARLVIGWDASWNGDVLVVDKTGTNVLYDATLGTDGNNVTINLYNQTGSASYNYSTNNTGAFTLVWHNNGSFALTDSGASLNITGAGPCTDNFTFKGFDSDNNATWSDSQSFNMYGAHEANGVSFFAGTLTGSIKVSGKGKGAPTYIIDQVDGILLP